MQTLVMFDIGDTRLRTRVEKACRDIGMERTQFSAFLGECPEDLRHRLIHVLETLAHNHADQETAEQRKQALFVQLFPMCAADFAKAVSITRQECAAAEKNEKPDVLVL